jgi:hypothetical protein
MKASATNWTIIGGLARVHSFKLASPDKVGRKSAICEGKSYKRTYFNPLLLRLRAPDCRAAFKVRSIAVASRKLGAQFSQLTSSCQHQRNCSLSSRAAQIMMLPPPLENDDRLNKKLTS